MRNDWFPRRIADYVTQPGQKKLRLSNTAIQRDFNFGLAQPVEEEPTTEDLPPEFLGPRMSQSEVQEASMFQKPNKDLAPKKLSPERSRELLEIFVPPTLEFYRQVIIEEKEPEPEPEPAKPEPERVNVGVGAGAELLAARRAKPAAKTPAKPAGPQHIYGSVSTMDVLNAVKAVMAENEEAARVLLHASDIKFVNVATVTQGEEGEVETEKETDRVKFVGDFTTEIHVHGAEPITRLVKVIAQEAA
jgi:hypothetical protein